MNHAEVSILLAVALLASFLLSGFEAGLLTLNSARLRHFARDGRPGAVRLEKLLGNYQPLLISILLLTAAFNLLAFALITHLTIEWLGNWGYPLAFLVSLPVYVFWIELVPKHLFRRFPIRAMSTFYPVLSVIRHTLTPVIAFFSPPVESSPTDNRAEFRAMTEVLEHEGKLEAKESELIRNVLDFTKVKVSGVMLPLDKATAIDPEMEVETILSLAIQTEFDQFPVISASGDLTGIVNIHELLTLNTPTGTAETYRRKLVRVAPDDSAISVIKRLRHVGHELAAVYNENDRPIGVVSLESMIQRMVKK